VLVACMVASAVGPLALAWLYSQGQLRFEHILLVAFMNGLAGTIEVPTRQSVVRNVVGERDLAAAIPAQAMTFNFARVVGPAVGGQLVVALGPQSCYIVNGCSYFALAAAVLAIRADLRATGRRREPIADLLLAGVKYTIRHPGLRTLFVMESATSVFGTFHLALMAAIAKELLGLGARGLGNAADKPWKARMAGIAMAVLGTGLGLLAWTTSIWVAAPLLAVIGAATIMQFNTTNTLFQLLSPPQLRGRVLSMHIWALSGLAPIGALFFGWLASVSSLRVALMVGSFATLTAATWAFMNRSKIEEPVFESETA
jgi:MFS family permease